MKEQKSINRRDFLSRSAAGLAAVTLVPPFLSAAPALVGKHSKRKVIVLGIDGMDPGLLKRFAGEGCLPEFGKMMNSRHFAPLQTTMPPQSPVAWSSFISGANPGVHGIYDFIHRETDTFSPYLSTSRATGAKRGLTFGKYFIPLESGQYELMRRGRPFWRDLEDADIPATLYKIPAAFPVEDGKSRIISGMSTPDILGTYGTFTLFSEIPVPGAEAFTGGRVEEIRSDGQRYRCLLRGPANSMRTDGRETRIHFDVWKDPWEKVIKISIQGREWVMKEGEWSEWIPVRFDVLAPLARIHGMIRVYAKRVQPHLMIYVSPINADPLAQDLPISNPAQYASGIAESTGRFYTQGFPEDTKALSHGVFSSEEFLEQSKIVLEERLAVFEHELRRFQEGFFFYYFSSIDQNSHMLLRNMMPEHPLYEKEAGPDVKNAIRHLYQRMDQVLRRTLEKVDDRTTLMIMSDHGFAPFVREINLSTWLVEQGFTVLGNPSQMHTVTAYDGVDWEKTRAYVMGLNSIYINRFGREIQGSVDPRHAEKVKQDIIQRLESFRDPKTGARMVRKAYDSKEIYSGPEVEHAPDIIIGYESGYRISDEAVLGQFPEPVVRDRQDKWSADHCMDYHLVPGVFLSNREITGSPAMWDLALNILRQFQIEPASLTDGKPVLRV